MSRIVLCIGAREEDSPLAEATFSSDPALVDTLLQRCEQVKAERGEPIYIDRNVAIYEDHYLAAFHEEDLEVVPTEGLDPDQDLPTV